MTKQLLFSTMVSVGLAFAPEAMAQATNMEKPMKDDKMMMDKKADGMAKPATSDMNMKKSDGMMDKKDAMSGDKMKK